MSLELIPDKQTNLLPAKGERATSCAAHIISTGACRKLTGRRGRNSSLALLSVLVLGSGMAWPSAWSGCPGTGRGGQQTRFFAFVLFLLSVAFTSSSPSPSSSSPVTPLVRQNPCLSNLAKHPQRGQRRPAPSATGPGALGEALQWLHTVVRRPISTTPGRS